jgi:uncharacterized protein YndB with AHSA1/START domain
MTRYAFVTLWHIDAPIDRVWEEIAHPERWPSWWKYVARVEKREEGDENGVGSLWHHEWKTALPYTLVFNLRTTRAEKPQILEAASTGELSGTGRWQLTPQASVTIVRYDWKVSTTKSWMNLLAPLARPLFAWNHKIVMQEGGEGLARLLGARLLQASHSATIS